MIADVGGLRDEEIKMLDAKLYQGQQSVVIDEDERWLHDCSVTMKFDSENLIVQAEKNVEGKKTLVATIFFSLNRQFAREFKQFAGVVNSHIEDVT